MRQAGGRQASRAHENTHSQWELLNVPTIHVYCWFEPQNGRGIFNLHEFNVKQGDGICQFMYGGKTL